MKKALLFSVFTALGLTFTACSNFETQPPKAQNKDTLTAKPANLDSLALALQSDSIANATRIADSIKMAAATDSANQAIKTAYSIAIVKKQDSVTTKRTVLKTKAKADTASKKTVVKKKVKKQETDEAFINGAVDEAVANNEQSKTKKITPVKTMPVKKDSAVATKKTTAKTKIIVKEQEEEPVVVKKKTKVQPVETKKAVVKKKVVKEEQEEEEEEEPAPTPKPIAKHKPAKKQPVEYVDEDPEPVLNMDSVKRSLALKILGQPTKASAVLEMMNGPYVSDYAPYNKQSNPPIKHPVDTTKKRASSFFVK